MDQSLRKSASIFATLRPSARPRKAVARPSHVRCETLEGRQLLTAGASSDGARPFMPMMANPADVTTAAGSPGDVTTGLVDQSLAVISGPAMQTGESGGPGGPRASAMPYNFATPDLPPGGLDPVAMSRPMHAAPPDAATADLATSRPVDPGQDAPPGGQGGQGGNMTFALRRGPGGPGDAGTTTQGNAALTAAIDKLKADQQAINDKSLVTPALLAAVRKDLEAISAAKTGDAEGAALATLKADAEALRTSGVPTDELFAKVQADASAVFLGEGVSQTLIDRWNADVLAVKAASNVTADDLNTLAADRAAIQSLTDAAAPDAPVDAGSAAMATTMIATTTASTTTATPATVTSAVIDPATTTTETAPAPDPATTAATDPIMMTTTAVTPTATTRRPRAGRVAGKFRRVGGPALPRMMQSFRFARRSY